MSSYLAKVLDAEELDSVAHLVEYVLRTDSAFDYVGGGRYEIALHNEFILSCIKGRYTHSSDHTCEVGLLKNNELFYSEEQEKIMQDNPEGYVTPARLIELITKVSTLSPLSSEE